MGKTFENFKYAAEAQATLWFGKKNKTKSIFNPKTLERTIALSDDQHRARNIKVHKARALLIIAALPAGLGVLIMIGNNMRLRENKLKNDELMAGIERFSALQYRKLGISDENWFRSQLKYDLGLTEGGPPAVPADGELNAIAYEMWLSEIDLETGGMTANLPQTPNR